MSWKKFIVTDNQRIISPLDEVVVGMYL